jgi:hypothetical protein
MPHLDPERLAALDHDGPTADERAHLAACVTCRREREAFAQLAALGMREADATIDAPRLTEWPALSAALRAEGLITRPSDDVADAADAPAVVALPTAGRGAADRTVHATATVRRRDRSGVSRAWPWWSRAAAAAVLFVSGAAVGRVGMAPASVPVVADPSLALTPVGGTDRSSDGVVAFGSVAEASAVLDRAQRDYERASLWLASHDTTVNAQAVYRARLAALEQMLVASRAGLFEAPQDPVLNQYYLAAYTAREATLRQLGETLPVDRVMESF